MNIVIYSSTSNDFDKESYTIKQLPACLDQWKKTKKIFKDINYSVVTQLPAMFVSDYDKDGLLPSNIKGVDFYLRPLAESPEDTAAFIEQLKPDIAVAASFWMNPFDYLNAKDALTASILNKKRIHTVNHSIDTCMTCFDKWTTHLTLKSAGFNVAHSVFINHNLYFNASSKKEILENVYKESVLHQIKNMHYPLIIKDTTGLSSVGMDKVDTYEEVVKILDSKKNSGDRIVEEYIEGLQAGCEIHGRKGKYAVLSPFAFSVNKYGITSPKQSVKAGPITGDYYRIDELKSMLLKLADFLQLEGIAQVDLVFSHDNWYIIEVNPRLSGMSLTYCASSKKTLYQVLTEIALDNISEPRLYPCLNIKLPILTDNELDRLKSMDGVKFIRQINNTNAKQERERGFCELILSTDGGYDDLIKKLDSIKETFPHAIESSFYDNAVSLLSIVRMPCKQ